MCIFISSNDFDRVLLLLLIILYFFLFVFLIKLFSCGMKLLVAQISVLKINRSAKRIAELHFAEEVESETNK